MSWGPSSGWSVVCLLPEPGSTSLGSLGTQSNGEELQEDWGGPRFQVRQLLPLLP